MKKVHIAICFSIVIIVGVILFYHLFGWFSGDILEYIQTNYYFEENKIISGEHIATGEDEHGGFIIYQVVTEDGEKHFVRANVVFHKYLTKVGPDYKIREIYEVFDYEQEYRK